MKGIPIIVVLLISFSYSSFSQNTSNSNSLTDITIESMRAARYFGVHDIDKAFDELSKSWNISENELSNKKEAMGNIFNENKSILGKYLGDGKNSRQFELNEATHRFIYVMEYENHELELTIDYYKNNENKWLLKNISWNNSFAKLRNVDK